MQWDLRVTHPLAATKAGSRLKDDHIAPLYSHLTKLEAELVSLQEDVRHQHRRLRRHQKTSKSTSSRVLTFSLVQAAVLITLTFVQNYAIGTFFRSKAGRGGGV